MKAQPILQDRQNVGSDGFAELRVWRVPHPVPGSTHDLKYSLAYVVKDVCVLRYDNEAGKGDHRHIGTDEVAYRFVSAKRLIEDFWKDVDRWPGL